MSYWQEVERGEWRTTMTDSEPSPPCWALFESCEVGCTCSQGSSGSEIPIVFALFVSVAVGAWLWHHRKNKESM